MREKKGEKNRQRRMKILLAPFLRGKNEVTGSD